ncbi:MAG: AEC family transporter [Rhodospirillales bacterium]|nr:AEC family transporter [Rhodospirillales bacterium]
MLQIPIALAPIFLLILLGYLLKKKEVAPQSFWKTAETLTYYVFFPSLLIVNTAKAELSGIQIVPMAAALVFAVLLISVLCIWLQPRLKISRASFTSLFQGAIRPNTYVGIAAAAALFGEPGLTLTAVCIVFIVPLVNFLAVTTMVRYGDNGHGEGPKSNTVLLEVMKNPIILACVGGGLLNILGIGLPSFVIGPLLEILGRAALPIGLLAVGAGLDLKAAHENAFTVGLSTILKLAALPLFTYLGCYAFGVEGITRTVAIIYSTLPCSASAYVLSRQMGGDATTMAGIITATTLVAMGAMPLALMLVQIAP